MKLRFSLWSTILGMAVSAATAAEPAYNLPPAQMLLEPGPGVGGPGPGVLAPVAYSSADMFRPAAETTAQILFSRPEGMQVRWDVGGVGQFDSEPLIVPGRQNFPQGGIYRMKLTNIPSRNSEGVELYPTLEVGPTTPRTAAFLAHNAIPVQFTEEDFDQVLTGNFVTKVIYLPDPEFQELALANVETLVSTRLDPGVDPVVEADRRGAIMAVVRIGNKDLEAAGSNIATGYPGYPGYCPPGMAGGGIAAYPNYVAGITTPTWGMPMSGTPIGLPGPPHIPLGAPAGLQKHVIKDHTHQHIPGPVEKFKVNVRQVPGYSYPKPPSHMRIREQTIYPTINHHQPIRNMTQVIPANGYGYGSANWCP